MYLDVLAFHGSLASLGLAVRLLYRGLVLWLYDAHIVGQRELRANLARRIPGQHDLDLDTQHTCTPKIEGLVINRNTI
jgi:hypothetical protein